MASEEETCIATMEWLDEHIVQNHALYMRMSRSCKDYLRIAVQHATLTGDIVRLRGQQPLPSPPASPRKHPNRGGKSFPSKPHPSKPPGNKKPATRTSPRLGLQPVPEEEPAAEAEEEVAAGTAAPEEPVSVAMDVDIKGAVDDELVAVDVTAEKTAPEEAATPVEAPVIDLVQEAAADEPASSGEDMVVDQAPEAAAEEEQELGTVAQPAADSDVTQQADMPAADDAAASSH